MASTPAAENQSLENNGNQDSELMQVALKADICKVNSSHQGFEDSGQNMDTQTIETIPNLSAKDTSKNQHSVSSTSKMIAQDHNSDHHKSENGSIASTYLDNSVSTYLESLNSRLDRLMYLPSGTEKLGEKLEPYDEPGPSNEDYKRKKVELFGPDVGPKIYHIKGNLVTPPIIAKNLPEAFVSLPIHGKPEPDEDIDKFYEKKIREFVGFDLNDEQFENLAKFCSPDHLRTGKELRMPTPLPTQSVLSEWYKGYHDEDSKLCVVKKHRLRVANDPTNKYLKRLKYRGVRLMPLKVEDDSSEKPPADLEPGKDIVYHVRIYRPFPYNLKEKMVTSRHSVFSRDVILVGRQRLSALRDRIVCANDVSTRLDTADTPDDVPDMSAKELFPSGFLFINNVFYVDERGGCRDRSAGLRAWARARGLGTFPKRDLHDTRIDELDIRLGHPEVYIHQGNCEHLFTFSEIRLLHPSDPLSTAQYPAHTAISQNQSVYCTTCAEFGAKWVVVGCSTVPFDPAYFCETCFKMYLYKDGKKIGNFKSYAYRGNEINVLKPSG